MSELGWSLVIPIALLLWIVFLIGYEHGKQAEKERRNG